MKILHKQKIFAPTSLMLRKSTEWFKFHQGQRSIHLPSLTGAQLTTHYVQVFYYYSKTICKIDRKAPSLEFYFKLEV